MQRLTSKDPDRTTADSLATLFGNGVSMWFSTKQAKASLLKSVATELTNSEEHHFYTESQYQEQDSCSSLSTGQSHHEAATSSRSNFYSQNGPFHAGSGETYNKRREDCVKPSLACETYNQSLDWRSYPLAGPYFGRITAAYEPNAVVYHQMMGAAPTRDVLPLDCTQGISIYVNSKQYHAILRRRQTRAKLEAQNKVARSRKPYLHESRHRHALKRARGSGGRFLNTKNMQQSKPATRTLGKNPSLQQISKEQKIQSSETNSWGTSTISGPKVSCIFNNDDIFQQPNLRISNSSGATANIGLQSRLVAPDDMLMLSMDRCARIRTAT